MLRPFVLIVMTLFLTSSGITRAQAPAAGDASDPVSVLARPDREVAKWALARFAERKAATDEVPEAWRGLEQGSFDSFMAGSPLYTRVFPSADRQSAVVVTYRRIETAPGEARQPTVTAHLEIRDAAGDIRSEFDVVPYLQFDLLPDGTAVVGHGELITRAMTDGVLHTSLAFYDGTGRLIRTVESLEFSPTHSTAILPAPRIFVLAVSGLILAYDLGGAQELWRRPLGNANDTASLSLSPDGRTVGALVLQDDGTSTIHLLDAVGTNRGRFVLEGRTMPGTGWMFDASGKVLIIQDIVGDATRLRILDAANLKVLKTIQEL